MTPAGPARALSPTALGTATACGALALAANTATVPSADLFWPPSQRSAPFLVAVSALVAAITVVSFCRSSSSAAIAKRMARKRQLVMAQLVQASRWERGDADDSEEKEGEEGDGKAAKPPETKDLFEMLFDEVEERHVTEFGIDPADPTYAGVLALFKARVAASVEEATRYTRMARGGPRDGPGATAGATGATAERAGPVSAEDRRQMALFSDGARLKELLDLYDGKTRRGGSSCSIKKAFGELIPPDALAQVWNSAHTAHRRAHTASPA